MENFLTSSRNRSLLLLSIVGLILVALGIFFLKSDLNFSGTKVEVLNSKDLDKTSAIITVEISGEVIKPGVYKLPGGSRVDDLLINAGGFSEKADRVWVDKYLNRAAKLTDGQKVYITSIEKQSDTSTANKTLGDQTVSSTFLTDSKNLIDINTASLTKLDSLPGIGQVYGQSIIEHRPYSNIEELVSKGVLKKSVYEKIKNLISVY